jgi:hypothetical protein
MIVIFVRRPGYILMKPHGDEPDPWWLSAGGLEISENFTDYAPYKCEHISNIYVNKLKESGIYGRLPEAPQPAPGQAATFRGILPPVVTALRAT